MATPGYVFRDGGPIPDSDLQEEAIKQSGVKPGETHASSVQQEMRQETSKTSDSPANSHNASSTAPPRSPGATSTTSSGVASSHDRKLEALTSSPTDSHGLAAADHEEKGAAQEAHFEAEVKDLGWSVPKEDISKRLVGGIDNEELWMLVRRFNKQMYHVKSTEKPVLAGLDLNIADEDEFSPDKLRANVERLYMTVIVSMISCGKHIARLRSWREPRRTGAFAAVYFLAWLLDFIMPLLFTTITVLILVPQSRKLLFPPAPIALVNSKTGGVQSPRAGVLGSHDTLTGAPENHKGEAAEQEASNFVAGIGTIALSSATGKHFSEDTKDEPQSPDPTAIAMASADAKASAEGGATSKHHDKTKQPMEDAMWGKMRPVMHTIGDISDGWERIANALSPTRPFSLVTPKLKLASIVAPGIAISMTTSSYMFTKMNAFFVGFGFFADPLIQRGIHLLNEKVPDWPKYLEVRNSLLKGVPTNAQLTITLLRVGEANKAPLPPPPTSDGAPPKEAMDLDSDELTIDASHEEIQDAIHPDQSPDTQPESPTDSGKKKRGSKVLSLLKGTTKAGVETKVGADGARAKVGSGKAKDHLGAVPRPKDLLRSGPVDFKARYKGDKGWVYINTSSTIPCVGFSKHKSKGTGEETDQSLRPIWSIPIQDITGLKKIGGYGWKAKLVVGWATDKTVVDGLEITDRSGTLTKITAVVLREELFNRLVAMGQQKWESW